MPGSRKQDALRPSVDFWLSGSRKFGSTSQDVRHHLKRMGYFKTYFSEYANLIAVGVVAGMVVDEDAARYAYREGLYVLEQSGETVRIRNDEAFQPKHW